MFAFVFRRLGLVVPTFLGVTLFAFVLIRLIPGDPVALLAGERGLTPERHAQMLAQLGLDRPMVEQYFSYLWSLAQGDFGRSLVTRSPVLNDFLTLFPATLELSFAAMIFAVAIGLPAGILAAVRRGSALDHTVMAGALTGYSMPIFWWGLLLIMLFSVTLGWTPVSGRISVMYYVEPVTGFMLIDTLLSDEPEAFWSALHHLVLPAIVLGTIPLAVIARMTRSSMLEVLGEDYVRTARAKGLNPTRVVLIHALRNALIPVITVIGLQVGLLLAGAILTETIFAWPGIGKWLIESIGRRDYPSVQGGILLVSCVVIAVNLIVDLLYGIINPRIRHAR
ncbi:MAG: peptide ABC transporter permease [Tistrella sp.]|jgi:dipeptide transport system permease protein|uniref:Peptide ABC transporter permease n=2 Tax=Tistrella mobilis TaxID=171437 RepID=A0A162LQ27_9PROT|nr:ABC transporter permease subunit [Tistrella mobilis]KYO56271.1 peptide ABC transporter permease [Tistrella mobilis]MBA78510.1 peptide ABC transporter permease [Tistrella sp.]